MKSLEKTDPNRDIPWEKLAKMTASSHDFKALNSKILVLADSIQQLKKTDFALPEKNENVTCKSILIRSVFGNRLNILIPGTFLRFLCHTTTSHHPVGDNSRFISFYNNCVVARISFSGKKLNPKFFLTLPLMVNSPKLLQSFLT